jgi:3'-5' exonuclease
MSRNLPFTVALALLSIAFTLTMSSVHAFILGSPQLRHARLINQQSLNARRLSAIHSSLQPQRIFYNQRCFVPTLGKKRHYYNDNPLRGHSRLFSSTLLTDVSTTTAEEDDDQDPTTAADSPPATSARASTSDSGTTESASPSPSPSTPTATIDNNLEDYLTRNKITSRPVPGGNWKPRDPLGWTTHWGRRSSANEERTRELAQQPAHPGIEDIQLPGVTQIRTREQARRVLERLNAADHATTVHACDTEVMDIDLSTVGPVGNGYVTCVSIYSGPDFDYGNGPGHTLWIDNLDDSYGVLQEFKEWFENPAIKKIWHNYGFDRHVMWNEGIDCQGLHGDTMHMARLQNTSLVKQAGGNGYALEALTERFLNRPKRPMKELFGVKRLRKDGSEGSMIDVPPVEVLQREPRFRREWINYSCYDAEGTYRLYQKLKELLKKKYWRTYGGVDYSLYEYYDMHMRVFAEVLTDMERRGVRVDARGYLASVELKAREDRDHHTRIFRNWAATLIGPDGLAMNPASSVQLQTFLFGGATMEKTDAVVPAERVFKVPREEIPEEALEAYRLRDEEQEAAKQKEASEKPEGELVVAMRNGTCVHSCMSLCT